MQLYLQHINEIESDPDILLWHFLRRLRGHANSTEEA